MSGAASVFPGGAFQGDDDSVASMGSITVSTYSVRFETEEFTLDFPAQGLAVDLDETGERVLFSHPNFPGWTVYSLDIGILECRGLQRFGLKDRVAELQAQHPEAANHGRRVYGALVALVLVMVGLWAFTNPILSLIVTMMPAEWETKVGKEAFDELTDIFQLSEERALTNRVFLVSQRLKRGLPPNAPKFRFHVAETHIVNAIALPGGEVVVMQGLLFDATPDELAGVLAHEMAHVIRKHGMRHLAQSIGPSFASKYISGGDGALSALMEGASELGQLHYSRDNEREADAMAFDILINANIDPRCLAGYFKKMRKAEGKNAREANVFSTHPATSERISNLEQAWAGARKKSGFEPVDGGPPLPDTIPMPKF